MTDNGNLNEENKPQEKPVDKPEEPPKDFKIAEIWIKNDTIALDAVPNFWIDKLRAVGILEYCKQIVYEYNPNDKKPRIILPNQHKMMNFARKIFRRR